jgi:hypothetical protein
MPYIIVVGELPDRESHIEIANGYRGVDRRYIDFPFEYYEQEHKIWDVYNRFEENENSRGYKEHMTDIQLAREIRDVYNEAYPDIRREILEIVFDDGEPKLVGTFIGYDIADACNSNILNVILWFANKEGEETLDEFLKMLMLISKNFITLLNEYQLFSTHQEAVLTLNLIEGTFRIFGKTSLHHHFEVVKLYVVD